MLLWIPLLLTACSPTDDRASEGPTADAPTADSTLSGTGDSGEVGSTALPDVVALVDDEAYLHDLEAFAVDRPPGTTNHADLRATCAERLGALGYEVTLHDYGTGVNVLGYLPGSSNADGAVVLSAHYDSVAACSGADDNASGVAATLEAARVLAEGAWTNDLWVACWDEEERGLLGAEAWAAEARSLGANIQIAVSFETIAYRSTEADSQSLPLGFELLFPEATAEVEARNHTGDFIAWIGDEGSSQAHYATFEAQAEADGLPALAMHVPDEDLLAFWTADLRRSDHAAFWEQGYPAVMVTDTAEFRNDAYHCRNGLDDSVDRLDPAFATQVVRASVAMAAGALGTE